MAHKTGPDELAIGGRYSGLTKREYFAAHIMAGLNDGFFGQNNKAKAETAVKQADELIAALNVGAEAIKPLGEPKAKTGVELIADERKKQIEVLGRTIELDAEINTDGQLSFAASCLAFDDTSHIDVESYRPAFWDVELWRKIINKPYKERLIIAGALIAAELDRVALRDWELQKSTTK